ncbi:MAG TPA: YbhB/YbcL family Raf kinase inhibitor-like protein [Elusimicrobiota bacterium]|nr:YbhB/YbcL family Raf kinase inhibitor-like protein [Elusimicrobiota bacterium]
MFELTSPAFAPSGTIPRKHSCDGADVSPRLLWSNAPAEARTIALIMEDPDAPAGLWIHWIVYDVPAASGELPEGLPAGGSLPGGGRQGASWGVDRFERVGYGGPCPPKGKPHRYVFTAYALPGPTGLPAKATKAQLLKAMKGKVLAQAELIGLYGR